MLMKKWFAEAAIVPLRISVAVLLIVATPAAVLAIEDTPENRAQQTDRYFAEIPIEALTRELMRSMVRYTPGMQQEVVRLAFPKMSPEQRAKVAEVFNDANKVMATAIKHIDFAEIKKIQRDVLIDTLTADEIAAMADFYISPAGKSAGAKMARFSEELMPLMTPILINAVIRAKAEEQKQ